MFFPRTLVFAILVVLIAIIVVCVKSGDKQVRDSEHPEEQVRNYKNPNDWRWGTHEKKELLCLLTLVYRRSIDHNLKEETFMMNSFLLNMKTDALTAEVKEHNSVDVHNDFTHPKQTFEYSLYSKNEENYVKVKLEFLEQGSWTGDFVGHIHNLFINDRITTSKFFAIAATFPYLERVTIMFNGILKSEESWHTIQGSDKVMTLKIKTTDLEEEPTLFLVLKHFPSLKEIWLEKVNWEWKSFGQWLRNLGLLDKFDTVLTWTIHSCILPNDYWVYVLDQFIPNLLPNLKKLKIVSLKTKIEGTSELKEFSAKDFAKVLLLKNLETFIVRDASLSDLKSYLPDGDFDFVSKISIYVETSKMEPKDSEKLVAWCKSRNCKLNELEPEKK